MSVGVTTDQKQTKNIRKIQSGNSLLLNSVINYYR